MFFILLKYILKFISIRLSEVGLPFMVSPVVPTYGKLQGHITENSLHAAVTSSCQTGFHDHPPPEPLPARTQLNKITGQHILETNTPASAE